MKKSALHKVAKYGRLEVVKDLIENGANPNLEYENRKKKSKYIPLELASTFTTSSIWLPNKFISTISALNSFFSE